MRLYRPLILVVLTTTLVSIAFSRAFPFPGPNSGTPSKDQAAGAFPGREAFFAKKDVTIAITDSGLGGLSIMADAAERLVKSRAFERARLVYVNALFSNDSGYNSLPSRAEKIRVFDNVLRSIETRFRPDLVLVACNTLSVFLPDTPAARASKTPIVGIVDTGVRMVGEALAARPEASVILFGTETTIAERAHARKLLETGILKERIGEQACPELASYIEDGPGSEATALLIASYVDEAKSKLPRGGGPVYAALVCTHYGYSLDLWKSALTEAKLDLAGILDPNARLADAVDDPQSRGRFPKTMITAKVMSMVEIPAAKRGPIGAWLEKKSPATAAALREYKLVPGLFEWKRATTPRKSS